MADKTQPLPLFSGRPGLKFCLVSSFGGGKVTGQFGLACGRVLRLAARQETEGRQGNELYLLRQKYNFSPI